MTDELKSILITLGNKLVSEVTLLQATEQGNGRVTAQCQKVDAIAAAVREFGQASASISRGELHD